MLFLPSDIFVLLPSLDEKKFVPDGVICQLEQYEAKRGEMWFGGFFKREVFQDIARGERDMHLLGTLSGSESSAVVQLRPVRIVPADDVGEGFLEVNLRCQILASYLSPTDFEIRFPPTSPLFLPLISEDNCSTTTTYRILSTYSGDWDVTVLESHYRRKEAIYLPYVANGSLGVGTNPFLL